MFKPPGTSVPSWKMIRRSSRCSVAIPPFTCLTTDTRMSWTCLCMLYVVSEAYHLFRVICFWLYMCMLYMNVVPRSTMNTNGGTEN